MTILKALVEAFIVGSSCTNIRTSVLNLIEIKVWENEFAVSFKWMPLYFESAMSSGRGHWGRIVYELDEQNVLRGQSIKLNHAAHKWAFSYEENEILS